MRGCASRTSPRARRAGDGIALQLLSAGRDPNPNPNPNPNQAAWRKDGDARVATLRAETEKDNLGKELLTDRYRHEFWESMATKVRVRVRARVSPSPNPNPNL